MKLNVNGADVEVDDRFAKSPLLWVLRDVLGMRGTKYGCGIGQCAACTVLIDGRNTKSCQTPAERAVGTAITTVEGASGPVVNAVRDAWHRGNVIQCGYCQGGQTLAVTALLETDRSPDDAAIGQWMNGNLCRCGTYALANFKLETTNVQTGVPIMVWRSVGNSHTEFARESAIDELAIAAGRDPVDLRRDLLAGTRAPCAPWNWPPSGAAGDPRCPRAAPAASPAAASWTAIARRSPRSPSITATGSTSRRSPSRWTAASLSTPIWSAPRSKAASSTRSAPPPG